MWQRFTERARRVVFFAQDEAGRLGENYVSTEHLLLGLVRENDSVAARLLDSMGVSLGRIKSEIEKQVTRGEGRLGQDMQLTPRAKRVIDLAYDEARNLMNNYIGTEHLLLGLVREGEGLAGRVLQKLGVDLDKTRRAVAAAQDKGQGDDRKGVVWPEPPQTGLVGGDLLEISQLTRQQIDEIFDMTRRLKSQGIPLHQQQLAGAEAVDRDLGAPSREPEARGIEERLVEVLHPHLLVAPARGFPDVSPAEAVIASIDFEP